MTVRRELKLSDVTRGCLKMDSESCQFWMLWKTTLSGNCILPSELFFANPLASGYCLGEHAPH